MRRGFARFAVFSGLALSCSLAGCGGATDDLPREAVSGTVSLDGQPLAVGVIQFRPSSPAESVFAGARINDGAFAIPRDEGPTPGNYRVVINSAAEDKPLKPAETSGEKMPGLARELIPVQYNSKSILTAKVEAGKANTFEFALKTK